MATITTLLQQERNRSQCRVLAFKYKVRESHRLVFGTQCTVFDQNHCMGRE